MGGGREGGECPLPRRWQPPKRVGGWGVAVGLPGAGEGSGEWLAAAPRKLAAGKERRAAALLPFMVIMREGAGTSFVPNLCAAEIWKAPHPLAGAGRSGAGSGRKEMGGEGLRGIAEPRT